MIPMKRVQFRLSEETLARLDWLGRLLDLNRSQVVRLAVAELYQRHCHARLVEQGDGWALLLGEQPIAWGERSVLDRLGTSQPEFVERLREGMADGEALGGLLLMLLAGGEEGEGVWLSQNYIEAEASLRGGESQAGGQGAGR